MLAGEESNIWHAVHWVNSFTRAAPPTSSLTSPPLVDGKPFRERSARDTSGLRLAIV